MEETLDKQGQDKRIALLMPAVALRGLSILPGMVIHFDLSRVKSIHAVEQAMLKKLPLFVIAQKDELVDDPAFDDLYDVGTITQLKQMSRLPNGLIRVLVEGRGRGRLISVKQEDESYLSAEVETIVEDDSDCDPVEKEAIARELKDLCNEYNQLNPKTGAILQGKLESMRNLGTLMDIITSSLPLAVKSKQQILSALSLQERYDILSGILYNEIQIGILRKDLSEKIKKKVDKSQKEYLLREQMNTIREELGENDAFTDSDRFLEALKKLKAEKSVKEKISREIKRFRSISSNSSESAVERAYIETLLEIPWNKVSRDNSDIVLAEKILKEDHYGLLKVKERILEFLAVRSLTHAGDSPIICLVGPPGTGKTSIAQSVARALNKEYVRISLGGVRDEAEIRGHRKTYVGAMPGRIAAGLIQAKVKNPLMLLDEIDKVSSEYRGDTSSALLEVLDSAQNNHFRDRYVEIPLDLSQVLFIATANSITQIPRPLLDRMEIIEIGSYTDNEKFHIAKEYLVRRAYQKNGMDHGRLSISDGALKAIITGYTKEAGVRGLERKIGEICRKSAKEIMQQSSQNLKNTQIKITSKNLEKYLGKVMYTRDMANDTAEIGIVRGLAWTSVGGDTLQIEVNMMPGKGELELTGQMGDVMKESAMTGLSYIRSISPKYMIAAAIFKENDFHIHIPQGAVPKDGPSAGITMATALISAICKVPVRADVAMTGEITLRGRVLPIGGLKEKILAAKMAGIKKVLVPKKNEKDIEEISTEITSGLEICYVEHMEDVLKNALVIEGVKNGN